MSFRAYILLLLTSLVMLFTSWWIVGAGGVFFTLLWPSVQISNYKKWRKYQIQTQPKKSLSFAIISVKQQKKNFKAINFIFSKILFLQIFHKKVLKRLSIAFDGISRSCIKSVT